MGPWRLSRSCAGADPVAVVSRAPPCGTQETAGFLLEGLECAFRLSAWSGPAPGGQRVRRVPWLGTARTEALGLALVNLNKHAIKGLRTADSAVNDTGLAWRERCEAKRIPTLVTEADVQSGAAITVRY